MLGDQHRRFFLGIVAVFELDFPAMTRFSLDAVAKMAVAAVLLAALSGARAEAPAPAAPVTITPETPLVRGPDLTLTVADYQQALWGLPSEPRGKVDRDPVMRRELLLELYAERLLAREAQRRGLDQQPEIQAQIVQSQRKILVNALVQQERAALKLPDFTALAEEYYLTHRQDYQYPERIQAAHILWKTQCACEEEEKRAQAEATLKELRAGADFAELAKQRSDDQGSAANGGNLGQWLIRGKLVKPFEDAAFALPEPGALSDVIKTDYGYHIIKLIAHEPATTQPFEKVKEPIIEEQTKQYQAAAHKAFVTPYHPKTEQYENAAIDAMPVTAQ